MTVSELLSRISSAELSEWKAYAQLEPFGEERADLRFAMFESIVVNMLCKAETLPADFMPDFVSSEDEREERERIKRNERLLEKVKALNAIFGGEDKRKNGDS